MIADCRAAYEAFEFHKVYHTLNQFCAVDLSSLYIDITKDRMYCDATEFATPSRDTSGDARNFRCALPIARANSRFHCRRSVAIFRNGRFGSSARISRNAQAIAHDEASAQVAELLRLRGVIGQAIEQRASGEIDRQYSGSGGGFAFGLQCHRKNR